MSCAVANQMVYDNLEGRIYAGVGWESEMAIPVTWTVEEVNDALDDMVEDCAEEYYDNEVFPIIATKSIRKTLDLKWIAEKLSEYGWNEFVEILFDGEGFKWPPLPASPVNDEDDDAYDDYDDEEYEDEEDGEMVTLDMIADINQRAKDLGWK